jgi:DNA-nicking Smr family endonuclease
VTRKLTQEERELWERLERSVRPLKRRRTEPTEQGTPIASTAKKTGGKSAASVAPAPVAGRSPALATLEERTRRRLGRGTSEVEARVDLHGMTQERAFAALVAFLKDAQKRGARLVLVITGKGGEEGAGRGVLRRSVPAWLARPDFRHLVVGFEEAQRRHGGAGALYVRIRKRRAPVRGDSA